MLWAEREETVTIPRRDFQIYREMLPGQFGAGSLIHLQLMDPDEVTVGSWLRISIPWYAWPFVILGLVVAGFWLIGKLT